MADNWKAEMQSRLARNQSLEILRVLRRVRRQMNLAFFDDHYEDIQDEVGVLIRHLSAPPETSSHG